MAKVKTGDELINTAQIARLYNVKISTVSKWKARHVDFPSQVQIIKAVSENGAEYPLGLVGDLYFKSEVAEWAYKHGKEKTE